MLFLVPFLFYYVLKVMLYEQYWISFVLQDNVDNKIFSVLRWRTTKEILKIKLLCTRISLTLLT